MRLVMVGWVVVVVVAVVVVVVVVVVVGRPVAGMGLRQVGRCPRLCLCLRPRGSRLRGVGRALASGVGVVGAERKGAGRPGTLTAGVGVGEGQGRQQRAAGKGHGAVVDGRRRMGVGPAVFRFRRGRFTQCCAASGGGGGDEPQDIVPTIPPPPPAPPPPPPPTYYVSGA